MAVYKVPQDVEAEDKLLGPFSFRQFVYLIIAGGAAFIAWLMWNISSFLVIIPIPIIIFFVVLALPLRKDQPMEIYLIAVLQFLFKPKQRLWKPDGIISLVQLTLPQVKEVQRIKDLTENEAISRLSYLADVMDTRGWASRGVSPAAGTASMTDDAAIEAQSAEDILDTTATVSQSFDTLIKQSDNTRRQDMIARLQQASAEPPQMQRSSTNSTTPTNPYDSFLNQPSRNDDRQASDNSNELSGINFNPYPTYIRQQVIQPLNRQQEGTRKQSSTQAPEPDTLSQQSASNIQVSPDIISLANNTDLTISTIAREAKRIQEKEGDSGEVVIPLR